MKDVGSVRSMAFEKVGDMKATDDKAFLGDEVLLQPGKIILFFLS